MNINELLALGKKQIQQRDAKQSDKAELESRGNDIIHNAGASLVNKFMPDGWKQIEQSANYEYDGAFLIGRIEEMNFMISVHFHTDPMTIKTDYNEIGIFVPSEISSVSLYLPLQKNLADVHEYVNDMHAYPYNEATWKQNCINVFSISDVSDFALPFAMAAEISRK